MLDPFAVAPAPSAPDVETPAPRPLVTRLVVLLVAVGLLVTGSVAAAATDGDRSPEDAAPGRAAADAGAAPAATADAPAAAPAVPAEPETGPAYRVASIDGGVFTHGWFDYAGSAAGATPSPIVGLAQGVDGEAYWLASRDGGVFAFGNALFHGSAAGASAAPITDIASTVTHRGYWLAAGDGGVFAFGDAGFFGAAVDVGLNSRIVGITATPSGAGYWLAAADGGVFAFGDATYLGALANQPVNARIVDLVATPTGLGYYLVAADGGVFTFGDATYHGSAVGERLAKPVTDMALHPDGSGYWLLSGDGGVYSYGEAPYLGAPIASGGTGPFVAIAGGRGRHQPAELPAPAPEAPVAAPAPAPEAPVATPAPAPAAAPGLAAKSNGGGNGKGRGVAPPERLLDNEFGWDISYPQCGGPFPSGPMAYAIIGVNGGRAFKHNKCLGEQWRWARSHGAAGIYVNVHAPRSAVEKGHGAHSDRQANCNGVPSCVFYNFGFNGIRDSLAYAGSQGVDAPFVWLDVEQLNYWAPEPALNAVVIRGAIDAVREAGKEAGIYSTPYQYRKITGDEQAQVPVWSAGAPGAEAVGTYCATRGFAGGPVAIVQLLPGQYDPNFACPGAGPMSRYFVMP